MRPGSYALVALVALTLASCELENTLLFRTDRTDRYELPENRIPEMLLEEVDIVTGDGVRIAAIHARQENDVEAPTALVFHGQGGNIDGFWDRVMRLWDEGLNVLIIDYRGYGKSEGEPSELGLYEDGRSAFQWLLDSGVERERVWLWGISLGTAVASQVAVEQPAALLVLDAPFTSMEDMVGDASPFDLPRDWVIQSEWDTLSRMPRVLAPTVVAHGTGDGIVPFRQGQRVFEAAPTPKRLVAVEGAGHNRLILDHADRILDAAFGLLD